MKKAKKLQKELCFELKDYYEARDFKLNKKEWNFERKNIIIPFFLMSTRGPSITISPSIVNQSEGLLREINSIITTPILDNGAFIASTQLNSSLDITVSDLPFEENVEEILGMYDLSLGGSQDIAWVIEWHKAYMEKVGWKLIDKMMEEGEIYKLYSTFFDRYLERRQKAVHSSYRLDFGSHATMIYLGYKNQEKDVQGLVEKTIIHFENSLFAQRAVEIQKHFLD